MSMRKDIVERLREWAAYVESFGSGVKSVDLSGMPRAHHAGSMLPKDTSRARETFKYVARLPAEHFETIKLIYLDGPRCHKVTYAEIARWKDMSVDTLKCRHRKVVAILADEIDFARELRDLIVEKAEIEKSRA